jgi:hypothetical protein
MSTWQQQQKGKMREYCFLKFVGILLPENVGILLPEKNCGNTVSQKLTTIVVRYNSLMNVSNSEGALEAVGVWAPPFSTFFLLESKFMTFVRTSTSTSTSNININILWEHCSSLHPCLQFCGSTAPELFELLPLRVPNGQIRQQEIN